MKYSLALKKREKGKVKYEPFSIGTNSLEEIDNFTSNFEDNDSLSEALVKQGLISYKDFGKYIAVVKLTKEKPELVMYGPIYKEAKEYLKPNNLIANIIGLVDKSNEGDTESLGTLTKLAGRFYRIPPTERYVGSIYEYVRVLGYNRKPDEILLDKVVRDLITCVQNNYFRF